MKIYDHRIPSSLTIITLPFLTRNPPFGLGEGPGYFRRKRKSGRSTAAWKSGAPSARLRVNTQFKKFEHLMQTNALTLRWKRRQRQHHPEAVPSPPVPPPQRLEPGACLPPPRGQAWLCSQAPLSLASRAPPLGLQRPVAGSGFASYHQDCSADGGRVPMEGAVFCPQEGGQGRQGPAPGAAGRRGPRSLR